jgi:hypothetical protein
MTKHYIENANTFDRTEEQMPCAQLGIKFNFVNHFSKSSLKNLNNHIKYSFL